MCPIQCLNHNVAHASKTQDNKMVVAELMQDNSHSICRLLSDPDGSVRYSPLVLAYCLPDHEGHVLCRHKLKVWLQDPLERGKPPHLLIAQLVASYPLVLRWKEGVKKLAFQGGILKKKFGTYRNRKLYYSAQLRPGIT